MFRAWKAPAAGVTMRSAMSSGSEAMVVSPSEVTKAGRLEDAKRFIGRVVEIEITDDLFSCYVLCGMNRKDMIHVEAWKELSRPARGLLKEGSLVSLRKVMLATRKAEKNKFSLSGCRMFVRFDKDASIEEAENAADRTVPGYEEVKMQDLPRQVPRTTLQAAGCLKEGAVAVRVEVLEVTRVKGKDEVNDKSMVKAHVADRNAAGKGYSAEILAWGDDGSRLHTVEIGKVYDIWPLCIFPRNDKQSFALRWIKNTKIEATKDMAPCDFAVRGELVELSQRKDGVGGRPDYKNLSATLVAASTLTHFLPERSSVKFDSEEVWELPFVIVTDMNLTTYEGCSSCLKKSCGHSAPKRVCYNVELMIADHTATLEGKVWTWVMDDVLKVGGIEKPEGGIANEEQVRKVLCDSAWSVRCTIVEEAAYQNRGARNRVQIVSMLSQSWQFRGTKNGLFALSSQNCRDGVPYVYARDLTVDAADQVVDEEQRTFEMVEMLFEIKSAPMQETKDGEKGVRLIFTCVDVADPRSTATEVIVMWVVNLEEVLPIARLPEGQLRRAILQPCVKEEKIERWQVVSSTAMSQKDIDPWRARKTWQNLSFGDSAKKRVAEEIVALTPQSKFTKTVEALKSPSNQVKVQGRE